eukprot:Em0001g2066a
MPSRNRKKRTKQRAEYLQKQEENKAKARERYKADPEKKKASVRESYKADPEKKKASADPEKKKASVRESYKADPEKKKASVRESYIANIEPKRAAKRQRYGEDLEENRAAKRQRYGEDLEENRAAKRQRYGEDLEENRAVKRQRYQESVEENRAAKRRIYRGNSATIKAARMSRYWKGRRTTTTTTTTTQRCHGDWQGAKYPQADANVREQRFQARVMQLVQQLQRGHLYVSKIGKLPSIAGSALLADCSLVSAGAGQLLKASASMYSVNMRRRTGRLYMHMYKYPDLLPSLPQAEQSVSLILGYRKICWVPSGVAMEVAMSLYSSQLVGVVVMVDETGCNILFDTENECRVSKDHLDNPEPWFHQELKEPQERQPNGNQGLPGTPGTPGYCGQPGQREDPLMLHLLLVMRNPYPAPIHI